MSILQTDVFFPAECLQKNSLGPANICLVKNKEP